MKLKIMKINILKTIFFSFSTLFSFSQSFDKAKLDTYFDTLEKHQKAMGSVALAKDGKIFYTKNFGFADTDNKLKINDKTKFRIASISKTFTAVLVLKAVEENKLKLEDKLSKFYPKIKNSQKITIENLLQMRSGIFNFTAQTNYLDWHTSPKTEAELIELFASYSPVFEPDTKFEYSNTNYVLLSFILQKIYKKSFANLVQEKISKPLKLKNTQMGGKINPKMSEAKSYAFENGKWKTEPETDLSFVLGAGGIISTTEDLILFHQGLFGGKLLNSNSLEKMKVLKDNYGMGIYTVPFDEKRAYSHNGGIDGFHTILASFLNEKVVYARLLNGLDFVANDIDIAVLSAVFGEDYDIPDFSKKPVSVDKITSEGYEGTYASSVIPLKINVFYEGKQLMAQATGQGAFPLTPTSENSFKFDAAGIVIEFPEKGKMILKQGGGSFKFEKEK